MAFNVTPKHRGFESGSLIQWPGEEQGEKLIIEGV